MIEVYATISSKDPSYAIYYLIRKAFSLTASWNNKDEKQPRDRDTMAHNKMYPIAVLFRGDADTALSSQSVGYTSGKSGADYFHPRTVSVNLMFTLVP